MTKKDITEQIAAQIEAGEDRAPAIAAEILRDYAERMRPTIEAEAAKALQRRRKVQPAKSKEN